MDQIVGAAIALIAAGLGFSGTLLVEWLRGKNELRRQATQQRIEAYRSFLRAVQMFDMHLDIPADHPAREGLPSDVEGTADLLNTNTDLFLFGSDKAQQVGTYLMNACLDNVERTPQQTERLNQWRYEFISLVREEMGESAAPRGEGRLPSQFLRSQQRPDDNPENQQREIQKSSESREDGS